VSQAEGWLRLVAETSLESSKEALTEVEQGDGDKAAVTTAKKKVEVRV